MTVPKPRALAALCLALATATASGATRADNGLPAGYPPGALAYPGGMAQGGLPAGLLPSGMYMPVYPGMYPLMPSPYLGYPGLLPPYLGGLPMALPGLLPTASIPPAALFQGGAPVPSLPQLPTLPGPGATPPSQATPPTPTGTSSGPEGIAPFTGFQLPAIGTMTEMPPLVPTEVQALDPPGPAATSASQAAAPSAVAPTPAMPIATAPVHVAPTPAAPTPAAPTPAAPAPAAPAPAAPAPVAPAPVAPTPVAPAPVAPTPVAPTPVAPTPVAPTPAAPLPMAPPALPFPFPFAPYAAPPAEPAAPQPPYTVRRVVSQQEKGQLLQMAMPLMTGLMRMSLADAVNHFAVKYKAKPGLSYDKVVEAMKRRATALGMQLVGEQRLASAGKDGVAAGPRIEVYSFWDAALGTALIQASPEFVVFLPGRVAVLEDANRDVWVMSMDWNPEWALGYKDKLAISDTLWRGAVDLRERLDAILRAAADGAP
jgi:uncharacterized protein (DUF302 family)